MGDGAGGDGKGGLNTGTVQIVVALIGVVGVIATALFTNWDKIVGSRAPELPRLEQPQGAPPVNQAALNPSASPEAAAGGPAQAGTAAAPTATGIWRDADGYSFDMTQTGTTIRFVQYHDDIPMGSGTGQISGAMLRYDYDVGGDRGHCTGQIAGDTLSGKCTSEDGRSWPFTVTR